MAHDSPTSRFIAAAVYSGHRFARDLDVVAGDVVPFRRENVELAEI